MTASLLACSVGSLLCSTCLWLIHKLKKCVLVSGMVYTFRNTGEWWFGVATTHHSPLTNRRHVYHHIDQYINLKNEWIRDFWAKRKGIPDPWFYWLFALTEKVIWLRFLDYSTITNKVTTKKLMGFGVVGETVACPETIKTRGQALSNLILFDFKKVFELV